MAFKVFSAALNLRSQPRVGSTNRLATLPQGQRVEKVGEAPDGWWQVTTMLDGVPLVGFVASRFLVPEGAPEPSIGGGLAAVHLEENRATVKRTATSGRAFPLGEADRPRRNAATAAERVDQLHAIVTYLDVEHHARYRAGSGATYCNIYAYDYCYLAGVYLPRVWWTAAAVADLRAGRTVPVQYDRTVREMNANSLFDWLRDVGEEFEWQRVADPDALQENANNGGVSAISAQRKDLNRSGHLCLVVPERPNLAAKRSEGRVLLPVQSQAGARNFCYSCGTSRWWSADKFRAFGFWVHE